MSRKNQEGILILLMQTLGGIQYVPRLKDECITGGADHRILGFPMVASAILWVSRGKLERNVQIAPLRWLI